MFFGNVAQVEVTIDKEQVNALLNDGWFLIDAIATHRKEYLFLLGRFDENRSQLLRKD